MSHPRMPKHCWKCKTTEGRFSISRTETKKDGTKLVWHICTPCSTKYYREYKRKRGPEYVREINKRTYEKHKEKWIARAKVNYAVKKGTLQKPDRCEVCELKKAVQGHHPDYSKPLEVIWLCSLCHADEHARLKSLKN